MIVFLKDGLYKVQIGVFLFKDNVDVFVVRVRNVGFDVIVILELQFRCGLVFCKKIWFFIMRNWVFLFKNINNKL